MSSRWLALWGLLALLFLMAGCELETPPPVLMTPSVKGVSTPLSQPSATPIPWPAERLVFAHLEKIWVAESAPPYALTIGQAPAVASDGYRVAYLLPDGGTEGLSQVYVLDPRSGQPQLVSGVPASYGPPVWAPSGSRIAYTSGTTLMVVNAVGEVQRTIADVGVQGGGEIAPAWSNDGQSIICPLTHLGDPELFAVRLDDGTAVRLSYTGGYAAQAPFVVLPRSMADFVQLGQDTEGDSDQVNPTPKASGPDVLLYTNMEDGGTLWGVWMDGTGRRRVLPELDHVVGVMRLSPDGQHLAVLRQPSGVQDYVLTALDLTTGVSYQAGRLADIPDLLHWSEDNRTLHWISEATIYRYTLASGQGRAIAQLPSPTATPTPTPLPVGYQLVYYDQGVFYRAEPYEPPEPLKEIATSRAVSSGYTLHGEATYGGLVAYPREADIYRLQLEGGISQLAYTFQDQDLVLIELIWSLQGRALLYAATYNTYDEEGQAAGRRVDLGVLRMDVTAPSLSQFALLHGFTGVTPLLYDEEQGVAILLPREGDTAFTHLLLYNVADGQVRDLAVQGDGAAAVSADRHWAVASDYEEETGQGFLHLYDLTAEGLISQTFALPEGTFVRGPLHWSPDGQYVAFIPIQGTLSQDGEQLALGIWAFWPELGEMRQVVAMDSARAVLVGWRPAE